MATNGDQIVTIGGRPLYPIIDDDDMSEASAYNVPSSESVKAYVDSKTGTVSVAELAALDAVTAGTVTASKAVVVDASKNAGDFNDLDCVNLDAGSSGAAGSVDVFPTTASKGKLTITCTDQTGNTTVTLSANAMGQATTVNIPDPGAAASYVVQSTAALTLAEVDVLDNVTPGTNAASKAVVAGTDGKIGAATFGGAITTEVAGITTVGIGAEGGETITAVEQGCSGVIHKTILTLTATPITLTDDPDQGQYGGVKIYGMPAGNNIFLGAVIAATLTLTNEAWTDAAVGDVGLGTTVVADGDALATTEQNIIATTEIAAMMAQSGSINASSTDVATVVAAGTTDTDIYLNVRIDDAETHTTDGGTITGTVTIVWANLGDF